MTSLSGREVPSGTVGWVSASEHVTQAECDYRCGSHMQQVLRDDLAFWQVPPGSRMGHLQELCR
jgi:hypothetical protein